MSETEQLPTQKPYPIASDVSDFDDAMETYVSRTPGVEKHLPLIVAVIVMGLAFWWFSSRQIKENEAILYKIKGPVQVTIPGTPKKSVNFRTVLKERSWLNVEYPADEKEKTNVKSDASFTVKNHFGKIDFLMAHDSRMRFDSLRPNHPFKIYLNNGNFTADFKAKKKDSNFFISARYASITFNSGKFLVMLEADNTYLKVEAGEALFKNYSDKKETIVKAGQEIRSTKRTKKRNTNQKLRKTQKNAPVNTKEKSSEASAPKAAPKEKPVANSPSSDPSPAASPSPLER